MVECDRFVAKKPKDNDRGASLKSWRSKTESQKTTIIAAVSQSREIILRLPRDTPADHRDVSDPFPCDGAIPVTERLDLPNPGSRGREIILRLPRDNPADHRGVSDPFPCDGAITPKPNAWMKRTRDRAVAK